MALHITNPAVEEKVRALASLTGTSMTEAVGLAVERSLARAESSHRSTKPTVEEALAHIASFNLRPINEGLSDDEILGYDVDGVVEE